MLRASGRRIAGYCLLVVLLAGVMLLIAPAATFPGASAQTATPAASFQANPCLAEGRAAGASTSTQESPNYDYVILLDVSGSMIGNYATYREDRNIFSEVKESLKTFIGDLQPGSMIYIIPFGNTIDPNRVRQFGIDVPSAPDGGLGDAIAYIDRIQADNDETHITESIQYALGTLEALRDDERQHIQTMLLYTDGYGNGPGDTDADGDFVVDNLIDALNDYKREQPYLFVKYVSLGVEVPNSEVLEQEHIEVLEQAEGVPPVREVRLAVIPDHLDGLLPGSPASNLLCATSGDLGDGLQVAVNDDPSELPEDVQVAFRSEGASLTNDGVPLTYTLANVPNESGEGPFTTYVEVRASDPEVFLIPSRLPVTFTVADPTPAVTLDIGEFDGETRTRGVDVDDAVFTLPLDLTAPNGGAVELGLDTAELVGISPGATAAFVSGNDDLGATATLSAERPSLDLRLTVPAADIAALEDGQHTLPVGILVMPQDAEVTITGADATPQPGGGQRITAGAALALNPQSVCGVEVAPVAGQVVLEGDQSAEAVPWETTVTLTGHDGCAGTLTFDDSALQEAIPGARAAFDVNGESPLQIDLGDTPDRVVFVVTAPRTSVLALGLGDHPQTVDLVASTSAQLSPPEGLTPNEAGSSAIPVTLPLVVADRPGVSCQLPVFADEAIVADGAQEPAITRSDDVTCTFAGDVSVTLRVGDLADGVSATLTAPGGTPGHAVTLDNDHPSATLQLEVDRSVPQAAGAGAHTYTASVTAQASSSEATLELDSQSPDSTGKSSSDASLLVRVAGEQVITIDPIDMAPDPVHVSTFDTGPDPLEWRGEVTFELSNGADGTLQIDLPPDAPVKAFFMVGQTQLARSVALAGQSAPLELVVQLPLAHAKGLPGSQQFDIPLTLDPQGARVEATNFARAGELYRATETVSLLMTSPPVAEVGSITLPPGTASTSDDADDPVRLQSDPISYDLKEGASAGLDVDDAALQAAYPGASAGFVDGAGAPVTPLDLTQNGHSVTLVIEIPRDTLTAEGPQAVPPVGVTVSALGEDTILTRNGEPVAAGDVEPELIEPDINVIVPSVTLNPGAWQPDVVAVPVNGSGTGEKQWERTLTLSDRSEGANPGVTLTPEHPALTARLFDGEIREDTLLVQGPPGQPVSAVFQPGHDSMIAVISAPEAELRALGLSTSPAFPGLGSSERHPLPVALAIDPRGSNVTTPGDPALREPKTSPAPVTAEVVEPRNNLIFGIPVLVLLLFAVIWALWPALPKDAAILVDGDDTPTLISSGTMIGPGMAINVSTNGLFGTMRGAVGGRITGNARFTADGIPITYQDSPIEPGKSKVIHRDDELTDPESNTKITYTRAEQ